LCYVVGPSTVQVSADDVLRADHTANLTCITDASNPAPRLSWWRTTQDGRLDTRLVNVDDVIEWQIMADHGGRVAVSQVQLLLKPDDDGMTVTCLANGSSTVSSQLQLRVRC